MRWRRHAKKAKRAIRKANRSTDAIEVKPGYLPWKLTCTKTTTRKRWDMEERTTHSDWTDTRPALLVVTRQFDVETKPQTHLKAVLGEREKLRVVKRILGKTSTRNRVILRMGARRDIQRSKALQDRSATTTAQ